MNFTPFLETLHKSHCVSSRRAILANLIMRSAIFNRWGGALDSVRGLFDILDYCVCVLYTGGFIFYEKIIIKSAGSIK